MVQGRQRAGAALSVALLALAVYAAPAAHAAGVAGTCERAAALTSLGDPSGAIETIEAVREAAPPASARVCAEEYAEAVDRRAAAAYLVRWAGRLVEAGSTAEGDEVSVPTPVPEGCDGERPTTGTELPTAEVATVAERATDLARACDAGNEEAAQPPQTTLAESSKSAWDDFRASWIDPWVPLLVALLVWAAAVVVVARALLWLPRWLGNGLAGVMTRHLWARRTAWAFGWLALAVSGALVTGLASLVEPGRAMRPSGLWVLVVAQVVLAALLFGVLRHHVLRAVGVVAVGLGLFLVSMQVGWIDAELAGPLTPQVWQGAVVGALAALALAAAWAAGNALMISPKGEGAPSMDYVRALAQQLGSGSPRGLEVPVGTDAEILATIGVSESPSNPLVAAAVRLAKLARPPAPWQLVVNAHTEETWSVELSRNHRVVVSDTLSRARLFRPLEGVDGDAKADLELAPFAAALAVVTIALAEEEDPAGLAGATRWQGVGLAYLGSILPRGHAASRPLFAGAVAEDPGNLVALTGYWHSLYRESTGVEDLTRYRSLLEGALGRLHSREPFLKVRIRYSRVAVGINLRSLGAQDGKLAWHAGQLLEEVQHLPEGVGDFKRSLDRSSVALVRSVADVVASPVPIVLPPDDRAPEENGPSVNYSLGCYYADAPYGTRAPRDVARAVRHLRLADADPVLAEWRGLDPQLAPLRAEDAYRETFGRAVPTDVLSVPPFSDHAAALRGAGLVSLDLLGELGNSDLWQLGLRGPTAQWVRRMVDLGLALSRTPLRPWRVPILQAFSTAGYAAMPSDAAERAALQSAILDACADLRTGPTPRQVAAWFCLGVPPRP